MNHFLIHIQHSELSVLGFVIAVLSVTGNSNNIPVYGIAAVFNKFAVFFINI